MTDSKGSLEPDSRPRPQYGEYATPEEVAAARGMTLAELRGATEPVARLAEPLSTSASAPTRDTPTPKRSLRGAPLRSAPAPSGRPIAAGRPHQTNHLLTVLLLVFGIWNTVTSIPSFLDLGNSLSQGLQAAGYGSVTFGPTAHVAGVMLLVFSFLVLLAAVGLSLQRIRSGRSSVWVPLAGAALWMVGLVIAMVVVVANTPGIATVMQNHS